MEISGKERSFRELYSIKEFIYKPSIEYQSLKLTAELRITRKESRKFFFGKFEINKKLFLFLARFPFLKKLPRKVLYTVIFLKIFEAQAHSFSSLSTRDLSCDLVGMNNSLETLSQTIHTFMTLSASCLYENSLFVGFLYNNNIPDKY